jgi:hypothetical protein
MTASEQQREGSERTAMSEQPAEFEAAVHRVIQMARELYGEPSYTYHVKEVRYSPRTKSHSYTIGDGPECSREEYEANVAQSKADETERFMGRLKRSYKRYDREQVAPAWREKLIALLPNYAEDRHDSSQ